MIVFTNPGVIDTDAAFTMGVNVKDTDSPIGYFGTGFKYGIATILRNGGEVTLWQGLDKVEVTAREKIIRGKRFNIIQANGKDLGFTTDLGRNWEPWMAFRELACNALDEGGEFSHTLCEPKPRKGHTTVIVKEPGITKAYKDRHTILLNSTPLQVTNDVEIHGGNSHRLFYRTVRVGTYLQKYKYTYNVTDSLDLTEDRTLSSSYSANRTISAAVMNLDDDEMLLAILASGDRYIEHDFSYSTWNDHSEAFQRVACKVARDPAYTRLCNPSVRKWAKDKGYVDKFDPTPLSMTLVQQKKLDKASAVLTRYGYNISDYPVIVVKDLGEHIYGLAKDGTIYLALACFEKGTKEVTSTLFEEWTHLETGFADETRSLQTWLFDQVITHIENQEGEPI